MDYDVSKETPHMSLNTCTSLCPKLALKTLKDVFNNMIIINGSVLSMRCSELITDNRNILTVKLFWNSIEMLLPEHS